MQISNFIPETRLTAVRDAITAVFGQKSPSDWSQVGGGVSGAIILHFRVGDRRYVLRVEPERIALPDRERGYTCMTAAAAHCAAPPVHHADPSTGIAIMDYVSGRPLSSHPGGAVGLVKELGRLIAAVRKAPDFPGTGDYPLTIFRLLQDLRHSPLLSEMDVQFYSDALSQILSALPWDPSNSVPSHNDPNPRNILFDGRRLWLVDWELASQNDPLVDLAILSTDFAQTQELEDALLESALGTAPDRGLRARLQVICLLSRLFYGCIVLDSLSGAPLSAQARDADALSPDRFRRAIADGSLASGTPETAWAFGRMSLRAFSDGIAAPAFAETLKLAEQG